MPEMCFSTAPSVTTSLAAIGGVRAALGHQAEHLALARRQRLERLAAALPAEQLGDHLGVDDGAPGGDPAHRRRGTRHVGDPLLQQVADALRAAADQVARVALLDVLGQHQHRAVRAALAHRQRRPQALVGERRRHPYVDDRQVGPVLGHRRRPARRRHRARDRLDPAVGQQPRQPLAQQYGIFGDHHRAWPYATTRRATGRPAPASGRPADCAPPACRRCRPPGRPARPGRRRAPPTAPPTPLSQTSTTIHGWSR